MKAQRLSRTLLAAAVGMALFSTANAREVVDSGVTFSVGGAYHMLDSIRNLDNSIAPEVGIGYRFNDQFSVEGSYTRFSTDEKNTSNSVDVDEFRLDAYVDLMPWDGAFTPYVVAGVSMIDLDADADGRHDDTRMHAGFGLRKAITPNLSVRGDLRAIRTLDYAQTEASANLALTWTFGSVARAAEPVMAEEVIEKVIEEVVVAPVILDGDNDGIADADDLCPSSVAGATVDAEGCEQMEELVMFNFDSADIRADEEMVIVEVADFLQRNDQLKVTITGYTDDMGDTQYNQELSEMRAEKVRQALVEEFGIDSARMEVKGRGEADPIATNNTLAGRKENRRVVMISIAPRA